MSAPGIYPMRVVTRLTGLTSDTIRAWERRYGAIAPARTQGNARRYRDQDIQRLHWLAALTAAGHSISALAPLGDEALSTLASTAGSNGGAQRTAKDEKSLIVDQYLDAVVAFDAPLAEERLMRAAALFSPREIALELVAPLMREVGDRWHDGQLNIAQEHLASGHARALLGTLLRTHSVPKGAARIVTATPPGHAHEIGAMIAAILCASRGVIPVHLGADVPYPDLERAAKAVDASVVALSVARSVNDAELALARASIPRIQERAEVWIGAPAAHPLGLIPGVRAFDSFDAFDAALLHRFPGG